MKDIYIKNGPSFRTLLSHGPLGSSPGSTLTFTVRDVMGKHVTISFLNPERDEVVGRVAWIGKKYRHPQTPGDDPDPEGQILLIEAGDSDWSWHYLLFNYNTRTRGGEGFLFTEKEWFENGVGRYLFSEPPKRKR